MVHKSNTHVSGGGGTGTVTEIDTGTGLSGGPITSSGTVSIANNTANTLAGFNNSGTFSDVAIGTNLTLSGGTLNASGGTGTVSSVSVTTANGVSGVVGNPTTTPAISLSLGAITPSSVNASGTVAGSNLSGTNTGDQTITLTGDVTGSGTGSFATTIRSNVGLAGSPTTTTQTSTDNSTKVATTAYVTTAVNNAIAGVNPAIAVQAATTQASDTSGLTYNNGASGIGATLTGANNTALTVDGYTFTALGQRLLVKNDTQSPSGAFNGVYYVTQIQTAILPLILTRALDYDTPSDINNTGAIPVVNGTTNATTSWLLTSSVTTVGTDPLTYIKFSANPTTLLTNTLTSAHVFVGNGSNVAKDVAVSGDLTATNAGAFTVAKINGTAVSGTTGTTNVVFSNSPTLVTPAIGTPTSGVLTNCTGSPTLSTVTANAVINANNAVTVTSNAGTCPVTFTLNTFTNSSAANMTITIATASAVDGQMMIVRIYDASAVAKTITWVNTENSTISAPTTSNGSTTLPLTAGYMYNSATSKWRCIASA